MRIKMNSRARSTSKLAILLFVGWCVVSPPCLADDEQDQPKGAAVTVLKAARQCFDAVVEASGILVPKEETTVEPNTQLGQVFVALSSNRRLLVNSSGRAMIKTGQSCGVSVPLTAILYGSAGTVVQVVRGDRVETRRVEIGLMSGGQVEIHDGLAEGDRVVARAGALLREGDAVRPVDADAK